MSKIKNLLSLAVVLSFGFGNSFCQETTTDTIPIRYIVWYHQVDTCYPILKQKKGYLVVDKTSRTEILTTNRLWDWENILDEKKKREMGVVIKFIQYYKP